MLDYLWHSISSLNHFLFIISLSVQFLIIVWIFSQVSLNLVWFLAKKESEFSLILCILSLISIVGGLVSWNDYPLDIVLTSIVPTSALAEGSDGLIQPPCKVSNSPIHDFVTQNLRVKLLVSISGPLRHQLKFFWHYSHNFVSRLFVT